LKCLSFDIWNTLLDLGKLYSLIAEELSEITERRKEEMEAGLKSAYQKALSLRLEGAFRSPILDSARVFASELNITEEELFRALVRAVMRAETGEMVFGDVHRALDELNAMNIKMGLLGNVMFWPGMVTRIILEKNGILRYFHSTIFSDESGVQKPDRAAFELLANRLECRLEEMVHVGDSLENDLAGALISGASAILIKRDSPASFSIGKRAFVVRTLTEIPGLLSKL
jgi:putative hydrolase of the HAD superfamily